MIKKIATVNSFTVAIALFLLLSGGVYALAQLTKDVAATVNVSLKVDDGVEIYLNRGASTGLRIGAALTVYRPGEILIDPDTGQNLGSVEKQVAKAKVTRVEAKFAIAELQSPAPGLAVKKGYIVRSE